MYGCTDCAEWWGPPPGESAAGCQVVWTPDPNDGVLKECSGHGLFLDGACSCYYNATGGYWALATLGEVQTCAECRGGYAGANCSVAV